MSAQHSSVQDAGGTLSQLEPLQVWGGAEYTRNRVGERYFDQMELSGHVERLDDYDLFAQLGLQTLRVGMLWERHELRPDWKWSDARLQRLIELDIRPIVSFVHHGSGPRHTSLHDPAFAQKLAVYAAEFAERYPWVDMYTPINEPNTTARFSGMYGLWHPHKTSQADYVRALLYQLKGTALAMSAIRRVRPDARLVQTDDVGRIYGTGALRSTWELLNTRQWLPFDLLCGQVDRGHPLFAYLCSAGISEDEILWFAHNACPPDILGVNYYVTSDRFLDERVELYPSRYRSAEGKFVDIESVRVEPDRTPCVEHLLTSAWERYRIPIAITEVHLGSSVDEQIRWLCEAYEGAMRARGNGVDCIAITAWALLGSFYWNELVTHENGYYEAGAFDVRNGQPMPTELAEVIAQIAAHRSPQHSALSKPGWWRMSERLRYGVQEAVAV